MPRRTPLLLLLLTALSALAPGRAGAGVGPGDTALEASILRVRPAVVLISSQVSAHAAIRCDSGPAQLVTPDPYQETGSGFVIHPDGYVATNGHVVAAANAKMEDPTVVGNLVQAAVEKSCGPKLAMLPDGIRKARLAALTTDPQNRARLQLAKEIRVHLSNGAIYPAEVLVYSPALQTNGAPVKDMGPMERSGKDIALLKIPATHLPSVPLAPNSEGLLVGEPLFVIGYPGVVLYHDFLSTQTALDATVTVGRVSGFKTDLINRRVIQTDAAITWGNSGGPAFNARGEVIGVATFISTTLEGDAAIQGFNFLIPVETVQEFARQIGVPPTADGAFARAWGAAVDSFFRGDYQRTLHAVAAVEQIRAGFLDVTRLGTEARLRLQAAGGSRWPHPSLGVGLVGSLGLVLLLVASRRVVRAWGHRQAGTVERIEAADVRARLQRGGVTLVDARNPTDYARSPVQAPGALRVEAGQPLPDTLTLRVSPDGAVIAYCT